MGGAPSVRRAAPLLGLLAVALLRYRLAFVLAGPKVDGGPSPLMPSPTHRRFAGAAGACSTVFPKRVANSNPSWGAAAGAASLLLAAAVTARAHRSGAGPVRGQRPCGVRLAPQQDRGSDAFVGSSVAQVHETLRSNGSSWSAVVRRSLYSCYNLYFKRARSPYGDRHRRNLRNRAYNIYHKNRYKKAMKRVLRYSVDLEFGDTTRGSLEEVMAEIKERLDDACLTIDEVCVQGILHPNTAARRKDRMCRAILRACVARGLVEKPDDPFMPAYKVIGYDMPQCFKTREPRPWQLPGWKSPWMLKREFDKWKKLKEAKMKDNA